MGGCLWSNMQEGARRIHALGAYSVEAWVKGDTYHYPFARLNGNPGISPLTETGVSTLQRAAEDWARKARAEHITCPGTVYLLVRWVKESEPVVF